MAYNLVTRTTLTLRALCLRTAMAVAAAALGAASAQAELPASIKIGVINDQSGVGADFAGPGPVVAAELAVADAEKTFLKVPVQIVTADHQNKPDLASSIITAWYDTQGVAAVFDAQNSAVSLVAQSLATKYRKLLFVSGGAASGLTNEACSPYGFQWAIDSYGQSHGLGNALTKGGESSWFFITMDNAFGKDMQAVASDVVVGNGQKVLGSVTHSVGQLDMSSELQRAQASGANVIGLATGAGDLVTVLKQAHEFGVGGTNQRFVAFLIWETDVMSVGLPVLQGLTFITPFYWDMTDETREFGRRFGERINHPPTAVQAAVYSSVLHYLKAVVAANTIDADAVAAQVRKLPINDFMSKNAYVRADGRAVRDFYLFQVKSPAESKSPWDLYKYIRTIPAEDTVRPLAESRCPMVQKK